VGPDDWLQEPALQPRKPWRAVLAKRRWRIGYNAGGGPDYPGMESYRHNLNLNYFKKSTWVLNRSHKESKIVFEPFGYVKTIE